MVIRRHAVLSAAIVLSLAASVRAGGPKTDWKFEFQGATSSAGGAIAVQPSDTYAAEKGYGFEPGSDPTNGKPFFFSVMLPEGNYTVTLTLGGAAEATTTVKAELRRLMLENVHTDAGKTVERSFTVNLRQPEITGGGKVSLKPREKTEEIRDWDDKLTLEFDGDHPSVSAISIVKADVPTVYILGDSTVCDQPTEPYSSWGQVITSFFGPGLAIANHAESGESLRSSLGAHRLAKVLSIIKPGDYLLIQYGHNDQKDKRPGAGAFTTYTTDLKKFVDGAKAKGASPVLITSMNRYTPDKEGHITNSLGDFPEAVRRVAKEENVPLIDLNAMSKTLYEAYGSDWQKAFAHDKAGKVDHTHHDTYGSYELAKCVVDGIVEDKLDLARYLRPGWTHFDPAHPDPIASVNIPPTPGEAAEKPQGN